MYMTSRQVVFTVSFKSLIESDMDIMTSSFSTRQKAEEFKKKLEDRIDKLGLSGFQVSIDAGYIDDDTTYIEWLDDNFEED